MQLVKWRVYMQESQSRIDDNTIPIGCVVEVHGSVVKIHCQHLPPLHQALKICVGNDTYILEVYQHMDQHHVKAIT